MTTDRVEAIRARLVQAEQAHGVYEADVLGGVYDQDWPRWYAAYAVEHGIGDVVEREVTTDRLAEFLATTYAEFERAEAERDGPWSTYIARRMSEDL